MQVCSVSAGLWCHDSYVSKSAGLCNKAATREKIRTLNLIKVYKYFIKLQMLLFKLYS